MRCKKHPADLSSGVGVCASCLRERLFAIMAAQAQKQSQLPRDCRKSDAHQQPPFSFPRSVSPYISRRKTDVAAAWYHRSLYSTPQLGPTASVADGVKHRKRNGGRFSALFLGLFRSKSDKHDLDSGPVSDPGVSVESCSVSPSWFSNMIPGRRKKQIRSFSVDESSIRATRRACRNRDRGMSPARQSDEEDDEHCHGGSSGYSSESSQGWRQTPRRTPATIRRRGTGHSRNVSGLAFCLSPLVRASPNRLWNQKGVPPDVVVAGESRVPAKPHLSAAASFCKNRSRKLADFGRYNSRH
ncbi:hypothetical protein C2S52_004296 [Perilla frutescens var. hirtella]|uniref:Uncharacterized protein n=1 Tax=Perilla frutescens var. hirtella TaxID=608512 RepID=A0AAD4J2V2_PERFH|nr:hypothetical protein C2S51_011275 [Perilla frutescens var. frutescens]KAH6793819.1 hypothetical protein C2S52_004296 [Perilla frutescens var. hirtella]KAH6826168.1 hypothetical protein C2S53_001605 [Perilla frutescens var. hirtella]